MNANTVFFRGKETERERKKEKERERGREEEKTDNIFILEK